MKRAKARGGKGFDLAKEVGASMTSIHRWGSDKPSATGVKLENFKALVKAAGYDLGDCLYFPDEVSHLRAVEIAVFQKEKQEPG